MSDLLDAVLNFQTDSDNDDEKPRAAHAPEPAPPHAAPLPPAAASLTVPLVGVGVDAPVAIAAAPTVAVDTRRLSAGVGPRNNRRRREGSLSSVGSATDAPLLGSMAALAGDPRAHAPPTLRAPSPTSVPALGALGAAAPAPEAVVARRTPSPQPPSLPPRESVGHGVVLDTGVVVRIATGADDGGSGGGVALSPLSSAGSLGASGDRGMMGITPTWPAAGGGAVFPSGVNGSADAPAALASKEAVPAVAVGVDAAPVVADAPVSRSAQLPPRPSLGTSAQTSALSASAAVSAASGAARSAAGGVAIDDSRSAAPLMPVATAASAATTGISPLTVVGVGGLTSASAEDRAAAFAASVPLLRSGEDAGAAFRSKFAEGVLLAGLRDRVTSVADAAVSAAAAVFSSTKITPDTVALANDPEFLAGLIKSGLSVPRAGVTEAASHAFEGAWDAVCAGGHTNAAAGTRARTGIGLALLTAAQNQRSARGAAGSARVLSSIFFRDVTRGIAAPPALLSAALKSLERGGGELLLAPDRAVAAGALALARR